MKFSLAAIAVVFWGIVHADEWEAQDAVWSDCQTQILRKLKAPGSAVFSQRDETAYATKEHRAVISGWVDSQNSYGALLRSKVSCDAVVFEEIQSVLIMDSVISDW